MAPPRIDTRIESLIMRLNDIEGWTMEEIGKHVHMHRSNASKII